MTAHARRAEQETLWRAHADELTRYATLLVGPDDADDVVVEAFIRVATRGLGDVTNRRAYLYRAATNAATDWKRSTLRRQARDVHALRPTSVDGHEPDPRLHRAIASLSVQQRAVVYFTYWEDLDAPAIGALLGVAPATVRRHLARAAAAPVDPPPSVIAAARPVEVRRLRRPISAVAAVGIALAGLGGLVALAGRDANEAPAALPVTTPPTTVASGPRPLSEVDTLGPTDWVITTAIPDGYEYQFAMRSSSFGPGDTAPTWRRIAYGQTAPDAVAADASNAELVIWIDSPLGGAAETVTIAGIDWQINRPGLRQWNATSDIETFSVEIERSGRYQCEWVSSERGSSGGCGGLVDPDAVITIDGGSGNDPGSRPGTVDAVRSGSVTADASVVEVEFADGTIVRVEPTDLSGTFEERFWIAGATISNESQTRVPVSEETVAAVRAFDADGNLLGTAVPPWLVPAGG